MGISMRSIEKSERTQDGLRQLAQDVVSELSELDPGYSKEFLGLFVSEMFRIVEERELCEMRRCRQAEGIAQAKAAGVRFGPERGCCPVGLNQWPGCGTRAASPRTRLRSSWG